MSRAFRAFVSCICLSSTSVLGLTDMYSEQTFLSREEKITATLRVREELGDQSARPFLAVGAELASFFDPRWNGAAETFVYAAPGGRIDFGRISFMSEVRFRKYFDLGEHPIVDARALLVYGDYWERSPVIEALRPFAEIYGEALLTSADAWNVIPSVFLRGGLRQGLGRRSSIDFFLEPFASADRLGRYYNNRVEGRLSVRVLTEAHSLSLSLTTSVLAVRYFSITGNEANPFENETLGARLLAVVGGIW